MFFNLRRDRLFATLGSLGLAVATIAGLSRADAASIVTWAFQGVTFSAGQTLTGTFTVDQDLGTLTDWNMQVSGGTNPALTDLSFKPGGGCVVFCGELTPTGTPAPSQIDVRTPLAPDNTFFELNLYFDLPLSEILHPAVSEIGIFDLGGAGDIDYEILTNPKVVSDLQRNSLSSTGNPRVVLTPEPALLSLFTIGSAVLVISFRGMRNRKCASRA